MDWAVGVRSLTELEDFSSALCTQLALGSTYPTVQWVQGGILSPGGKVQPGCDADHSPPSSAEVKKERCYTSSPHKRLSWHVAGQLYFTN
jgi:hypothetical protein